MGRNFVGIGRDPNTISVDIKPINIRNDTIPNIDNDVISSLINVDIAGDTSTLMRRF